MAEEIKQKKKGFLSRFFEEEPEVDKETSTDTKSSNNQIPSSFSYSQVSPVAPATPMVGLGAFDPKIYDQLQGVIERNNMDGIDYYEYSKAKKALDSAQKLPEPSNYLNPYISFQVTSGLTKDKLLSAIDFYVEKLNQEEEQFTTEMSKEVLAQVENRLNSAKEKQTSMENKVGEITKLQAEIAELQNETNQLNMEAQQFQANIDATAKNFKVTLEFLKNEIATDKDKISKYIQS